MKDLTAQTSLPRETIHYYAREGLLPPYEKTSQNQAEYGKEHVERILMIKELQEKYFLPISIIKLIIQKKPSPLEADSILKVKSEYLNPLDQLLPDEVIGEEAFLALTNMTTNRLADFEQWGILNPQTGSQGKIYSHDDIKIGKLIGDMRRLGVSYENGFKREGLKECRDAFMPILEAIVKDFWNTVEGRFDEAQIEQLITAQTELLPLFFYHLSHIILREGFLGKTHSIQLSDKRTKRNRRSK
jgi:DNA-binding transcriptional MerR regulator